MAHFIRPNGRLDKTYPNQYGHTIPHSWSNKITKQEVHKSYILNLFGCHLIVLALLILLNSRSVPPTYLKTEMSRPQRRLRRPAPRCENVLEQSLERASKHGFNCFEKLGNVLYWLTQSDRSTPLEVTAFFWEQTKT